jgi:Uma2 family endonuclease
MNIVAPGLPLRRFSVRDYHRMRDTGVLAPQAGVELLDGAVADKHEPSAREVAVIRKIAERLADTLSATVRAAEPVHPEAYAVFDPTLMVHDWEAHPLTEPCRLHRFSAVEYQRLWDVGILGAAERCALLDGIVLEVRRHGQDVQPHVERIAGLLGDQIPHAIVRVGEPLRLGPYSLVSPDLAVCRRRADGAAADVPTGPDAAVVVDVSRDLVDERWRLDWPVYARWGIPLAWLVDVIRGEVRIAREPGSNGYGRVEAYRRHDVLVPPAAFSRVAVGDILG